MAVKASFAYIVRCSDGSLYTGWTIDLQKRVALHAAGKGAKYTRSRMPVQLVYSERFGTSLEAQRREREIKKLSHLEKNKLVSARHSKKHKN